ncbi:MAG: hypothetical protein PUC12_16455 [Clostridiales bacterium]|nr:hypothetical protein [Clostridiales bacterium]
MRILLDIFLCFIICILAYYAVVHLIKVCTGCNESEAIAKLHNFINGKRNYQFYNDIGFSNELWERIRLIIGEKRYAELVNLNNALMNSSLLSFGENSGLPYISVSLFYEDDNEKIILQTVIVDVVRKHLQIYGFAPQVLVDWKERYDLKMPFIEVRYARTPEEKRVLALCLQETQRKILNQNSGVIDDTEDVTLDG